MKLYARNTTVSVGKTQADIRKEIEKYNGQWVGVITDHELTRPIDHLIFRLGGFPIRFDVFHPKYDDPEITGYNEERAIAAEYRRRWREIFLIVKSRLIEAIQLKRDVREVFMAQLVTKNGKTMWQMASSEIDRNLSSGNFRQLLALPEAEI